MPHNMISYVSINLFRFRDIIIYQKKKGSRDPKHVTAVGIP